MSEAEQVSEGVDAPENDANASQSVDKVDAGNQQSGSEAESSPAADQASDTSEKSERKGVQKRLDELTRNWREAERREAQLMKLLEQQRQVETPAIEPEVPRTLADFNYDENAYRSYLYDGARKVAAEAARAEASKYRQEQEQTSRRSSFETRIAEFAKTHDDFHEVFTDSTPISKAMAEAIEDSDQGPEVAYYLGNNPDIASKLYNLSPAAAAREIGRIEAKLESERKAAVKKLVSNAPAPAPKLDAGDPGMTVSASSADSDKLSSKDWLKRREKELAKRG